MQRQNSKVLGSPGVSTWEVVGESGALIFQPVLTLLRLKSNKSYFLIVSIPQKRFFSVVLLQVLTLCVTKTTLKSSRAAVGGGAAAATVCSSSS